MTRLALAALAGGLLLGGCAGPVVQAPPEPVVTEPERLPDPPEPPPPPQPVPVPPDAAFLHGRTGEEIVALLGPPALLRRERGVESMQYLDADCVLDIRLRPPPDGSGAARADHLAARGRRGEAWQPADCLARLLPERHWPRQSSPSLP